MSAHLLPSRLVFWLSAPNSSLMCIGFCPAWRDLEDSEFLSGENLKIQLKEPAWPTLSHDGYDFNERCYIRRESQLSWEGRCCVQRRSRELKIMHNLSCFMGKCDGRRPPKGFVAPSPAAGLVIGCATWARSLASVSLPGLLGEA